MAFRIEHRIGVAAPAAEVWDLVRDLEGWPGWTELYTAASGRLAIGETLSFTFKLGDRPPQTAKGVVYDWVPEAQMAWRVKFIGNFLTSLRYVEIEKLTETSCILANGDIYNGWLTFLIPAAARSEVRAGFERMNQNAKRICEARFAAKGGVVEPAAEPLGEDAFAITPLMKPTGAGGRPWGFGKTAGRFGPGLKS